MFCFKVSAGITAVTHHALAQQTLVAAAPRGRWRVLEHVLVGQLVQQIWNMGECKPRMMQNMFQVRSSIKAQCLGVFLTVIGCDFVSIVYLCGCVFVSIGVLLSYTNSLRNVLYIIWQKHAHKKNWQKYNYKTDKNTTTKLTKIQLQNWQKYSGCVSAKCTFARYPFKQT